MSIIDTSRRISIALQYSCTIKVRLVYFHTSISETNEKCIEKLRKRITVFVRKEEEWFLISEILTISIVFRACNFISFLFTLYTEI